MVVWIGLGFAGKYRGYETGQVGECPMPDEKRARLDAFDGIIRHEAPPTAPIRPCCPLFDPVVVVRAVVSLRVEISADWKWR